MAADTHKLSELVHEFENLSQAVGLVLHTDQLQQLAVDATRYYCAYGSLESAKTGTDVVGQLGRPLVGFSFLDDLGIVSTSDTKVGSNVELTLHEWAVIRPLFALLVERQNAIHLEASRGQGVDVYGRSVSECNAELPEVEARVQQGAFQFDIFTVGGD